MTIKLNTTAGDGSLDEDGGVAVHGSGGRASPDAVLDGSGQLPAAADPTRGSVRRLTGSE